MKFLSAKQVSELWGVSPRRVTFLASQGRIEGAEQIEGRWFIPENAEKPGDPRRKGKTVPAAGKVDDYIFPFPQVLMKSGEQSRQLSPGEAALRELCSVAETGDFSEARTLAESLLASENRYVRLGALYQLPMLSMYLGDYAAAEKYTLLFRASLEDPEEHRPELTLLLRAFDAEMKGLSEVAEAADDALTELLPDELLPYAAVHQLLAVFYRFAVKGIDPDIGRQELMCRLLEPMGFFYCTMLMHLYLSFYYARVCDAEKELRHLRAAAEIGIPHGSFLTLALFLVYNPEASDEILSHYPAEAGTRIRELSKAVLRGRSGYAAYQRGSSVLSRLNADDYRIISLCFKEYSIDRMAVSLGLSGSGMKKRLSALYRKLGVKSKSELLRVWLRSALDWK